MLFTSYKNCDNDILMYNMRQHKYFKFSNKDGLLLYSDTVFKKDDNIYIISKTKATIYKFNLKNYSFEYIGGVKGIEKNTPAVELMQIDDLIYLPINPKRQFLIFDLKTEKYEFCRYPDNISVILTLCHGNGNIWITGDDRKIYTWNIENRTACECSQFPEDIYLFFQNESYFENSFVDNNILWLFPGHANAILKYNIITQHFENFKIPGEEENINIKQKKRFFTTKYRYIKKNGNKVFFLSSKTRVLYELDLNTQELYRHYFCFHNIFHNCFYPTLDKQVIVEGDWLAGLRSMIQIVKEIKRNDKYDKQKQAGVKIYQYLTGR